MGDEGIEVRRIDITDRAEQREWLFSKIKSEVRTKRRAGNGAAQEVHYGRIDGWVEVGMHFGLATHEELVAFIAKQDPDPVATL